MIKLQALGERCRNQDWLQARRDFGIGGREVPGCIEDLGILAKYLVTQLAIVQQFPDARQRGVSNNHSHSALIAHRLSDRLRQFPMNIGGRAQIELTSVLTYRVRWFQRRRNLWQQSGCEVDHCPRHPEPGYQLLDRGIGMAEMCQWLLPGARCPRRRRL